MPAKLSTHVLDLTTGRPAAGMTIELRRVGKNPALIRTVVTNADGRTDAPLLDAASMAVGTYELLFFAGDYFSSAKSEPASANPGVSFLDRIPVRFGIADVAASYHVPLLVTPWAYQTYRGS